MCHVAMNIINGIVQHLRRRFVKCVQKKFFLFTETIVLMQLKIKWEKLPLVSYEYASFS